MRLVIAVLLAGITTPAFAHATVDAGVEILAPGFVPSRATVTYAVKVTDYAYDAAFGMIVTQTLPAGAAFVSAKGTDWNCSASHGTLTCSAERVDPGFSVITVIVTAPPAPATLHTTATLSSLAIFDPYPPNDTAAADTVVYDTAACPAGAPSLTAPLEASELESGVVQFNWSAVPNAVRYRLWTAVEGAKPSVLAETAATSLNADLEGGWTEWWAEAVLASCPPQASGHRHVLSRGKPPRMIVSTFAGIEGVAGHADGDRSVATFELPAAVGADIYGDIFVADAGASTIRWIHPDGRVSVMIGRSEQPGSGDGFGSVAQLNAPLAISVAPGGHSWVADSGNQTVREVFPNGTGGALVTPELVTLAGAAGVSGFVDGRADVARFNTPIGVAALPDGSLFISDAGNHGIRRMQSDRLVTTIGAAAGLLTPAGLALDAAGNLFIADRGDHVVRKLSVDGSISTFAGVAGQAGLADGVGAAARFDEPSALAFDALGNLWVADTGNDAIRRIAPSGLVQTIIHDGLSSPSGIAFDASGGLLIADRDHFVIRRAVAAPPPAPPVPPRRRSAQHN